MGQIKARGLKVASKASEKRNSYASPAIIARRKRILEIARELISEKGYAQFNLGEVGQRAGVAKQTVYNIFGSRERIIATAINDYFEEREARIRYVSQPATMERMIERLVVATHASESMPHYLGAVMAIYFSVDTDPDIWAAMHRVATYPHRAWIESLAEKQQLQPWIEPSSLIDTLAAHTSLAVLDWCRGKIDTGQSIHRKVVGTLTIVAGSTIGEAQADAMAKLDEIHRHGIPDYAEALTQFMQPIPDNPPVRHPGRPARAS